MSRLAYRDIVAERLLSGGWLLAVVHGGRRITGRYFEMTLREAKQRFAADVKAGAV